MVRGRRALGVAVVLCAMAARGEELETHLETGIRAGLALPVGTLTGGTDLSSVIAWSAPLQLDAGARIGPVFVGGFGTYAFGKTGSSLDGCTACSVRDVRFGLEVLWHLRAAAAVDPWVGLGVGYEWLTLSGSGTGGSLASTVRGFEFVDAQLGVDVALTRLLRVGPWAQATLGQFTSASADVSTAAGRSVGVAGDLQDKKLHGWLSLGLRMALLL